jgi:hypothetical protein
MEALVDALLAPPSAETHASRTLNQAPSCLLIPKIVASGTILALAIKSVTLVPVVVLQTILFAEMIANQILASCPIRITVVHGRTNAQETKNLTLPTPAISPVVPSSNMLQPNPV